MNLKSLFQFFKLPKKGGDEGIEERENQGVAQFILSFTNLEDTPTYELIDHFTIGSDVGDMVLEDCRLSPKHATFSIKDGVATIMDYGSSSGTMIGDHRIESGKSVILNDGDIIILGDVHIQLLQKESSIDDIEFDRDEASEPQEEVESQTELKGEDELENEAEAPEFVEPVFEDPIKEARYKTREIKLEGQTQLTVKPMELKEDGTVSRRIEAIRAIKSKGTKKEKKIVVSSIDRAANTLPRLVGLIFDIFAVIIVWQILSPFDDFRVLTGLLPELFSEYLLPEWEKVIDLTGQRTIYDQLSAEVIPVAKEFFDQFLISSILSLLIMWRMVWSLLIGSSLGMWMAGIRSYGTALSKRAGGFFRELIGVITFPFIIFDLPALISRRTFKEVVTRTNLYTPSKGAVLISWLFFAPILVASLIISPLFRGLEFNEKIAISNDLSVRLKSKKEEGEAVAINYQLYKSRWFGLELELDPMSWIIVPKFIWAQTDKGSILQPALVFHHQQDLTLPLLLLKNFDWYSLLNLPMSHNPLLQKNFPEIWAYVQSQRLKEVKNIQYRPTDLQKRNFEVELQELISTAFNLDVQNILEHILTHGPLIKGLVEFRQELLNLLEGSLEGEWKFGLQGKSIVLIREINGVKPYDLIVPLNQGRGRIFKIAYGSMKEKQNLTKLTRDVWSKVVWSDDNAREAVGSPVVVDIISLLASSNQMDEANAEKLFQVYFELASQIVTLVKDDQRNQSVLQSLKGLISLLLRFQKIKTESIDAEMMEKLINKMKEVLMNLENSNQAYFQNQLS